MIFFCIIVHLRQHPWRDTTDTEINILFAESPELPKVFSVSWSRLELFKTFSRAVSRCMGAAMTCLAWMSSAVLYWVVSRFLARPVEWKCCSLEPVDSLRPLFKAIVYSRSWVRNSVYILLLFRLSYIYMHRFHTVKYEMQMLWYHNVWLQSIMYM